MFSNNGSAILCLLVAFVLIFPTKQTKDPEFLKTFQSYQEECAKEEGLDGAYIAQIWASNHIPTNDQKLSCYYKCLVLNAGIMTQAGEVLDDALQKMIQQLSNDDEIDDEITRECGDIDGADLCETGLKLIACIKAATLD